MTSAQAARFIRSHGPDAWATTTPRKVLAMDVTTQRTPHGIIVRAKPVLLPTGLSFLRLWLGY